MMTAMRRHSQFSTFALICVLAAALSLAACGRKSGLDLPPTAAAAPAPQAAAQDSKSVMSPMSKPAKPKPRVVPNRSLPIDVLLD
jgi:predicted small lipoprotein YifL